MKFCKSFTVRGGENRSYQVTIYGEGSQVTAATVEGQGLYLEGKAATDWVAQHLSEEDLEAILDVDLADLTSYTEDPYGEAPTEDLPDYDALFEAL